ncbi:hypothetical protein AB0L05_06380 [Nonomuraea pusilla]|uniref:hypothetical protein n=1 Tax=Nonomuraea pusilla TaxID=46177 RepID=UPI00332BA60E
MEAYIEVSTTVEGHGNVAALAHRIVGGGLAASIDISPAPGPRDGPHEGAREEAREGARDGEPVWELTLVTTGSQAAAVERHIREAGGAGPIIKRPLPHRLGNRLGEHS